MSGSLSADVATLVLAIAVVALVLTLGWRWH
jgi:hypothetical protein